MKNFMVPAVVIFFLLSVFGCSDKLNNSKAAALIKEARHYPDTEDVSIEHGLIAYRDDSLPRFYYILQQKGMFTVEYLGKGGLFTISHRFRVTPTAEGKKYIIKEDKDPVKQGNSGEYMYNTSFKTCEVDFDKVKDIQEIPAFNAADITYVVKRTNFTPFWNYYLDTEKKMPDTIQERKLGVVKTNEGWKRAHK